jgi:hypothetical protein
VKVRVSIDLVVVDGLSLADRARLAGDLRGALESAVRERIAASAPLPLPQCSRSRSVTLPSVTPAPGPGLVSAAGDAVVSSVWAGSAPLAEARR